MAESILKTTEEIVNKTTAMRDKSKLLFDSMDKLSASRKASIMKSRILGMNLIDNLEKILSLLNKEIDHYNYEFTMLVRLVLNNTLKDKEIETFGELFTRKTKKSMHICNFFLKKLNQYFLTMICK